MGQYVNLNRGVTIGVLLCAAVTIPASAFPGVASNKPYGEPPASIESDPEWPGHRSGGISYPKQEREQYERLVVGKVSLGTFARPVALCLSEEDATCWVLNDLIGNINVVDLRRRCLAGAFGSFHHPQAMHYLSRSRRLLVVEEWNGPQGSLGARIRLLDPTTCEQTDEITISDRRAWSINSAAVSKDECTLWLVTAPLVSSAMYESSPSVVYRVDLAQKTAQLCVGPTEAELREPKDWAYDLKGALDSRGRLLLADRRPFLAETASSTISRYDAASGRLTHLLDLPQEAHQILADPLKPRLYVSLTKRNIAVIDTEKGELDSTIRTKSPVTAMCVLPETGELVVGFGDSHDLQVFSTDTLVEKRTITIPTPHKRHAPDIAGLYFDSKSDALIAATRWGALALYDTRTQAARFLDVLKAITVRVDPRGEYAYTCNIGSGNVSVVDLRTDTFVGTIQTGGEPWDIDFLPDGRRAVVADAAENRLLLVDLEKREILDEFKLEGPSHEVAVYPYGKRYVACSTGRFSITYIYGDRLYALEKRLWPRISRQDVHKRDRTVAMGPNTGVWVKVAGSSSYGGFILIGNAMGKNYLNLFAEDITSVALSPDEKWAYVLGRVASGASVLFKVRVAG